MDIIYTIEQINDGILLKAEVKSGAEYYTASHIPFDKLTYSYLVELMETQRWCLESYKRHLKGATTCPA